MKAQIKATARFQHVTGDQVLVAMIDGIPVLLEPLTDPVEGCIVEDRGVTDIVSVACHQEPGNPAIGIQSKRVVGFSIFHGGNKASVVCPCSLDGVLHEKGYETARFPS